MKRCDLTEVEGDSLVGVGDRRAGDIPGENQ